MSSIADPPGCVTPVSLPDESGPQALVRVQPQPDGSVALILCARDGRQAWVPLTREEALALAGALDYYARATAPTSGEGVQ